MRGGRGGFSCANKSDRLAAFSRRFEYGANMITLFLGMTGGVEDGGCT